MLKFNTDVYNTDVYLISIVFFAVISVITRTVVIKPIFGIYLSSVIGKAEKKKEGNKEKKKSSLQ